MGRNQADVAATALVAALACWAAAIGAPAAVTAALGIAAFAAPGYLLGQLLVGSRTAGLERVAVMGGLALAVPVLGGLLLFAAGVPLQRHGWLGLLAGVTLAGDVALLLRRGWWPGRAAPSTGSSAKRLPFRHTAVLAAAVLVAGGAVVVARIGVAIQPKPGFTQLWLAPGGHGSHAENLGVSNNEGSMTSYRLVLVRNSHVSASWNFTLADGRTWQRSVPFTGSATLTARLYLLPDLTHPYRYVTTGSRKAAGS